MRGAGFPAAVTEGGIVKKIYDIRDKFERVDYGTDERLTVAKFYQIPAGCFFIRFSPYRDISGGEQVERKRPFEVVLKSENPEDWLSRGWFKTLKAAVDAAEKLATE